MAQNYMMGAGMAQPPAPGSPQSMNFQSDPNMRSQFKGFMSGIQAKRPAQMMPPAQPMAPAIPPQMANVDIFAAPQGFHQGGVIPALESLSQMGKSMSQQIQSVTGGGPGLSGMVGSLGGSGMGNGMSGPPFSSSATQVSPAGGEFAFPGMFDVTTQGGGAFASDYPRGRGFGSALPDESGMPMPTPRPFSSLGGALGNVPGFANGGALDAFGGAGDDVGFQGSGYGDFNPNTGGYDIPSSDEGSFNAISAMARNAAAQQRPTALDDASAYIAGLFGSGSAAGPDFGRDGDNLGNAPTAAGGITDALADQIAQNKARQEATAQIAAADRAAMQPQIDAIAGSYTPGEDRQIMDLLNAQNMAQDITRQGGTVDVNPVTGQVIATDYPTAGQPMTAQRSSIPGTSDQGFRTVDTRITPDVDYADPTMVPIGSGMSTPISMPDQIALARGMKQMDDFQDTYNMSTPISMPDEIRDRRMLPVESVIADDIVEGGYEELVGATPEQGRVDINRVDTRDIAPKPAGLTVQEGFGVGMDPLEQLASRSQRDIFEKTAPGIGGAIQGAMNMVARGVSGNVLDKIAEGGQPVMDSNNQIVGVVHSGLFGGNVYTGRPEFNPTGRGGNTNFRSTDIQTGQASTGNTGNVMNPGALDRGFESAGDAGDSFLKMLGFGG